MTFIKKKENFICEKCTKNVIGNGFTNHCPNCLWSKHLDIDPGDRRSHCGGMMLPIGIRIKNKEIGIMHKCIKCGFQRWNKASSDDNQDEIFKISSKAIV